MRFRMLITIILSFFIAACAKMENDKESVFAIVKGAVSDIDGNPIEHMEVTIDLSKRDKPKTVYTSSDGTFVHDITYRESRNLKSLTITLNDIDGEENGGLFESKTEEIFIYEEDILEIPVILNLDFRCSRATL